MTWDDVVASFDETFDLPYVTTTTALVLRAEHNGLWSVRNDALRRTVLREFPTCAKG